MPDRGCGVLLECCARSGSGSSAGAKLPRCHVASLDGFAGGSSSMAGDATHFVREIISLLRSAHARRYTGGDTTLLFASSEGHAKFVPLLSECRVQGLGRTPSPKRGSDPDIARGLCTPVLASQTEVPEMFNL